MMREQPSGGHIFNMDGAGADGGATPRFAAYGATKRGLAQLGKSLQVGGRWGLGVEMWVAAPSTITTSSTIPPCSPPQSQAAPAQTTTHHTAAG